MVKYAISAVQPNMPRQLVVQEHGTPLVNDAAKCSLIEWIDEPASNEIKKANAV